MTDPIMPPLNDSASSLSEEMDCLNKVKFLFDKDKINNEDFMSWAAFHASL